MLLSVGEAISVSLSKEIHQHHHTLLDKKVLFSLEQRKKERNFSFYSFSGAENEPRDIHPHQGLSLYGEDANKKLQKPPTFSMFWYRGTTRWIIYRLAHRKFSIQNLNNLKPCLNTEGYGGRATIFSLKRNRFIL